MATTSPPSPESNRGQYPDWRINVGSSSSSERMRERREHFYADRANLMFQQLLKNPPAGAHIENYADYAVSNPDHADFGLKTFQQLKDDHEHSVTAERVPAGKTLSDYLFHYFKMVYGGHATRQQIWKEVWLSVYYLSSNEFEYDKDGNVIPLNVDQVITGNKIAIQDGRLTILKRIKDVDGTFSYSSRIRGVPLRPGTGWQRPPDNERHTADIIKNPGEEAARQRYALMAMTPRIQPAPVVAPRARTTAHGARPRVAPRPALPAPLDASIPQPNSYEEPRRAPSPRPAPAPAPTPIHPVRPSPAPGNAHEDMPAERPPSRTDVTPRPPIIPRETPEQRTITEFQAACANANGAIDFAERTIYAIDDTQLNETQRNDFNTARDTLIQARSKYSDADRVRRALPSATQLTPADRANIAPALTNALEAMRLANEAKNKVVGFPPSPQIRNINFINANESRAEIAIRRRFAIPEQVVLGIDDRGNYWVTESRDIHFPQGIRIGGPLSPPERPAPPDPAREERERIQTSIQTGITNYVRKRQAVERWLSQNPRAQRTLFDSANTDYQTGLTERQNGNLERAEGDIQIANSYLDTFIEQNHISLPPQ